jgi:hypothetical protein
VLSGFTEALKRALPDRLTKKVSRTVRCRSRSFFQREQRNSNDQEAKSHKKNSLKPFHTMPPNVQQAEERNSGFDCLADVILLPGLYRLPHERVGRLFIQLQPDAVGATTFDSTDLLGEPPRASSAFPPAWRIPAITVLISSVPMPMCVIPTGRFAVAGAISKKVSRLICRKVVVGFPSGPGGKEHATESPSP